MRTSTESQRIQVEVDAALEASGQTWIPAAGDKVWLPGINVQWEGVATGAAFAEDGVVYVEARFGEHRRFVELRLLWRASLGLPKARHATSEES